jgi:IPT/TIG domain
MPELPWVETRVNGYGVEYEPFYLEDVIFPENTISQIRGVMGAIQPIQDADIMFRFRAGSAIYYDATLVRCDYTNTTCFRARGVAVMRTMNYHQGYSTGGQIIKVTGHGFNSKNIVATIGGAPCIVQRFALDYFTCMTTESTATDASVLAYVGEHGLRRRIYNQTTSLTYSILESQPPYKEVLAIDFETPKNEWDGPFGNVLSGYFKAPATANYRFYMTCDDLCRLYLSKTSMSPSAKTLIYEHKSDTGFRDFYEPWKKLHATDWIALTKDEYYYIEGQHIQGGGGDHFTVGLEIDDPNQSVVGHHHTRREVQRLRVSQTVTYEQTLITITNPDDAKFTMTMQKYNSEDTWTSDELGVFDSNGSFEWYLWWYYSWEIGGYA